MSEVPREWLWFMDEALDDILAAAPEPVRDLIEVGGLDVALRLLDRWRGQQYYFPKPEQAFRALRDRRIRGEHKAGTSANTLAKRYDLAVARIYEICREPDNSPPV